MRYLIILFLFSLPCMANEQQKALRHVQRAVFKTETLKRHKNNVGGFLNKAIPDSAKKYVFTIGAVGSTIIRGKVGTESIKNMNIKYNNGNIRPNVDYDFRNNQFNANIVYTVGW